MCIAHDNFHDQELYLELKKLQKLVDDDCIDIGQLNSFMKEIMEAALLWISNKSEIHLHGRENLHDRRVEFLQVIESLYSHTY